MAFMKFSKGKKIYSVPNGLGDGSAYFNKTEGVIANIDNLPYGNSARSISLWCYWREINPDYATSTMFCYGSYGENNRYTISIKTENSLYTIVVQAQGNTTTYNYALEFKKWYHIVVTLAEDYTEKCYINGVLVGTQTHANVNTIKATGAIGRSSDKTTRNDWFYGNLKELNVYNRVLSADEVTALYNKQEIIDGRVLHIPLQYGKDDDSIFTSKNFVYDYSILTTSSGFDEFGYPIRYDVASECGVAYSTYPVTDGLLCYFPFNTDYKDKITGINLKEEGTITLADNCVSNVYGSYLHGTNNVFTLPNTFTLSTCVYLENNGCEANRTIVDFGSYHKGQGFGIWTDSSNILKYRINQKFANVCEFEYQKWFMVTMTYNGQKVVFYIDGVESGSVNLSTTVKHGNEIFLFKRPYVEDSIVGKIKDILLYNRVLTLEEIQALIK